MANYQVARVKLGNSQLNNLNSTAKNKAETKLRITKENFQDEELPHELPLIRRQKTKIRNAFANNMSTDEKLKQYKTVKHNCLKSFNWV